MFILGIVANASRETKIRYRLLELFRNNITINYSLSFFSDTKVEYNKLQVGTYKKRTNNFFSIKNIGKAEVLC